MAENIFGMRPSNKSRSRNKSGGNSNFNNNNQRRGTMGNIINRVFESAGPDGKVRGTPQQIIDKYQALARDAQVAGDRVAAESYLQFSEHYSRLLGEAQRQQSENRSQQDRDDNQPRGDDSNDSDYQSRGHDDGQQNRVRDDGQQNRGHDDGQQNRGHNDGQQQRGRDGGDNRRRQEPAMASQSGSGLAMIEPEDSEDISGPIDTPEGRRSPRDEPAPVVHAEPQPATVNGSGHAPQPQGTSEAPVKRARPRRRAPKADGFDAPAAEVVSQGE